MKLPIYQVDAFAGHLFSGNPAAIVILESELASETMQAIAEENNLSETAFIVSDGEDYHIRWFTPRVEVDLCGHATLAAAHVLFHHLGCSADLISFSSRSGPLHVRQDGGVLFLNLPTDTLHPAEPPQDLIDGLGARPAEVFRGRDDFLAILDSEGAIASLSPDMALLSKVPSRGVIVTAQGREVDFVSRFFAPQLGVPEDPVTGSAHATLVPYWSRRLGRPNMNAQQLSRRGGELVCKDLGERVEVGGRAVTYLVGEISLG
ncbi:PhzF family phenazine biosynthesis protein [Chloroflexota bacterium]